MLARRSHETIPSPHHHHHQFPKLERLGNSALEAWAVRKKWQRARNSDTIGQGETEASGADNNLQSSCAACPGADKLSWCCGTKKNIILLPSRMCRSIINSVYFLTGKKTPYYYFSVLSFALCSSKLSLVQLKSDFDTTYRKGFCGSHFFSIILLFSTVITPPYKYWGVRFSVGKVFFGVLFLFNFTLQIGRLQMLFFYFH